MYLFGFIFFEKHTGTQFRNISNTLAQVANTRVTEYTLKQRCRRCHGANALHRVLVVEDVTPIIFGGKKMFTQKVQNYFRK